MTDQPLDYFTKQAIDAFGNAGAHGFYERLGPDADGRPMVTRCAACSAATYPPREHCPECLGDAVEWVPLAPDGATLYAFTTNRRGLRFGAPAVIGVVDVPEVGFVLAPIAGALGDLRIGMPVRPEVVELSGGLRFHRFTPTPS